MQSRLTQLSLDSLDQTLLSYDANSNVLTRSNNNINSTYGYDELDRLIQQINGSSQTDYSYDRNGNRLQENNDGVMSNYSYAPQGNQLNTLDGQSLVHDAAGNLTQDAQGRTFIYNDAGRLELIEQGGNTIAQYRYASNGLRSHKVIGANTSLYHYDLNGQLVSETKPDGSLIKDYLWHNGNPVAQIDNQATEIISYLHTDRLQTARLATDQNQSIVWRWEGKAFGETPAEELAGISMNLRFPGQYFDAETGLHYNWYRYYSPVLGRYITSDPIGLEGGLNTYVYAYQNPLIYQDADGRVPLIFLIPALGGALNGTFSAINSLNDCNADLYSVVLAFGKGFAGGFVGTTVGMVVGLASKNPALAGSAGGLAGNLVEQALSGERLDALSAAQSVAVGGMVGPVANKLIPTRGFLPSLTKWRNSSNFGPNSQRLLGQEAVSGSISGAIGSIQDLAEKTGSFCECQ